MKGKTSLGASSRCCARGLRRRHEVKVTTCGVSVSTACSSSRHDGTRTSSCVWRSSTTPEGWTAPIAAPCWRSVGRCSAAEAGVDVEAGRRLPVDSPAVGARPAAAAGPGARTPRRRLRYFPCNSDYQRIASKVRDDARRRGARATRLHRLPGPALAGIWSTNPLERVNNESNAGPTSSECSRRPRRSASPAMSSSKPPTDGV